MGNFFWSYRNVSGFTPILYGGLYNFYAGIDARELSNIGWHLPSLLELQNLSTYLGGTTVSGGKLKETGYLFWTTPNTGATNEVGFNLRGCGIRAENGVFSGLNASINLMSSTASNVTYARTTTVGHNSASFTTSGVIAGKTRGQCVRLLKDSTTLTHGQTGTYIGNDGKIYPTICIGTQEWVACNIAETKFRTGELIPFTGANGINFTNAEWAGLSTPALCAYNNDWSNV